MQRKDAAAYREAAMEIQVYTLPVDRELGEKEREKLLDMMPLFRRQRLVRTRESKQIQALCAYGLLRYALERQYGYACLPPMAIAEEGKPYFPDLPKVCFNLSHTEGAVLCALHDRAVGVDVERHRAAAQTVLHYYHITETGEFWNMWVHREAIAKCRGKGFAALTHWDASLEERIDCRALSVVEGFHAAVATEDPSSAHRCILTSLEEILQ